MPKTAKRAKTSKSRKMSSTQQGKALKKRDLEKVAGGYTTGNLDHLVNGLDFNAIKGH